MADIDTAATGAKAKLDDTELSDDLPKALQKVDLDLDDAPFLEDEKQEEPPAQESSEAPAVSAPTEESAPQSKKKLFVIAGLAVVLIAGAAIFFLTRKSAPPPEPVEQKAPEPAPEPTPPPPLPEPPAPKPEIVMPMEPFLVEMTDSKGHSRFLSIRFTAVTQEKNVEYEFKRNIIVVRDGVYYYLKNKNLEFLTDKNNTDALKKDVLSVINQFMGPQPLDNLLIEDYLVK